MAYAPMDLNFRSVYFPFEVAVRTGIERQKCLVNLCFRTNDVAKVQTYFELTKEKARKVLPCVFLSYLECYIVVQRMLFCLLQDGFCYISDLSHSVGKNGFCILY